MYANGFFEQQQRRHPASFALVVALHAAGLGAVILAGSTQFVREDNGPTIVRPIPIPPDPPPNPQPPERQTQQPEHRETFLTPTQQEIPTAGPTVAAGPTEPTLPLGPIGERTVIASHDPPPPPAPVRREAQLDPRYAGDLQPPYPRGEEAAGRGGSVRIRLTIGANGRVTAVERLQATSDAFWQVTQRQALNRWRFRPATLDGRPVQGVKVMTVNFRIEDARA